MRFALDTEFDGFGGELISLALHNPQAEWYAERECAPQNNWVIQNVVPRLSGPRLPDPDFFGSLHGFVLQHSPVEVFADSYADLMHFFACFEGQTYADSLNVECMARLVKTPLGYAPEVPHHALHDAKGLWRAS